MNELYNKCNNMTDEELFIYYENLVGMSRKHLKGLDRAEIIDKVCTLTIMSNRFSTLEMFKK